MNRSSFARGALLFSIALVVGGALGRGGLAPAAVDATAGPFQCQPGFYQVMSGQLYELNPVTDVYTKIGSAYSTSYNAMGYNVLDNYLYAMGSSGAVEAHLLKIAADGSVTDLGQPTDLPLHDYISGDMDASGNLLVQYTGTTWYAIDVSANTATSFTVTGDAGSGNDTVWIDGYLYFASGDTLYAIDLTTDQETSTTVSGLPSSASYGAAWSDKPSDMFISNNADGDIYQITGFAGSSPSATQVATGDETSDNDGAACKQAASPFVLPVANADTYTATTDVTLSVDAADGVLANDSGAGLTVLSHTNPSDGTLTLNGDGSFTYAPDSGFHGTDSFTYDVQDQYSRDSAGSATVTINVDLPAAPVANNDTFTTPVNTTLTETAAGGVLANDTGTGITVTSNTTPTHGSLALNSNGSFTYTPVANSSGTATFGYTIDDAFSRTSSADVTIAVTPTVENGSATTPYDTPLTDSAPGVLAGAVGSGLAVSSYGQPLHGSVTVASNGSFSYTPDLAFDATDSFTFVAKDGDGQTVDGTFSVGVGAPAAPDASGYSFTVAADSSLQKTSTTGLLSADSGASITVSSHTSPADGSVSVSAGGAFTYTPNSGFSGHDSFSYTITDAVGQTASGTVSIDVTPVAVTQTYDTPYETSIGKNVLTDDIGSGLSIQYDITAPSVGVWSISGFGSVNFAPPAGFAGPAEFTYDMMDSSDQSATGTVIFDVGDPPTPQANADSYTTPAGSTLAEPAVDGLLANDTGAGIAVTSHTSPAAGSLSLLSDGSFSYAPAAGSSGSESFSYTIEDAVGQTATADVTIAVTPTVESGSATTAYDTQLTESAPGVLTGAVGSGLTVSSYGQPLHGSVTVSPDGSFTYTPNSSFHSGTDSFTFVAEDGDSQTVDGTFSVGVGAPPTPEASSYGFTTGADSSLVESSAEGVLSDDSGLSISVTTSSHPSDGSATVAADGAFTYVPDTGFSGSDSFTYTITDEFDQTATGKVTIDVAPVAVDQTFDTPFETGTSVDVLTADIGSGLWVQGDLSAPSQCTWSLDESGTLSYTPGAGFAGPAMFTYAFEDGSGQSTNGSVTIDVGEPAAPTAADSSYTTAAGQTLEVGAAGLLSGSTGYSVQVATTTTPSHGSLSVNADGSFEYFPEAGFSGSDSFGFTITDPFDQTSSAEATITVDPVANDIDYSTPCGAVLNVSAAGGLLSSDLGTSLGVSAVSSDASLGSVNWQVDGAFTFTPAAGSCASSGGLDYTITDADDLGASAMVTFAVGPPASTLDLSYSTTENASLAVPTGTGLLGWVTGSDVTVVSYTQPAHGSVSAGPDGSFTYTPEPGYSGPDSFTYTAEDAGGVLGVGTVSISVAPAADPPTTVPTPTTGMGPGQLGTSLGAGMLLVVLGAVTLLGLRRRKRSDF